MRFIFICQQMVEAYKVIIIKYNIIILSDYYNYNCYCYITNLLLLLKILLLSDYYYYHCFVINYIFTIIIVIKVNSLLQVAGSIHYCAYIYMQWTRNKLNRRINASFSCRSKTFAQNPTNTNHSPHPFPPTS